MLHFLGLLRQNSNLKNGVKGRAQITGTCVSEIDSSSCYFLRQMRKSERWILYLHVRADAKMTMLTQMKKLLDRILPPPWKFVFNLSLFGKSSV